MRNFKHRDEPTLPSETQRAALSARLIEGRQVLATRTDISERMRELSGSSSRNAAPPLTRRRLTPLTLTLAVAAVLAVLLLTLGISAMIGASPLVQNQLDDASTTVDNFYGTLRAHDYAGAYALLSTHAQATVSESRFESTYSGYDQLSGSVQRYSITRADESGDTATCVVSVVRRGDSATAEIQNVQLIKENGVWHIASITRQGDAPAPTASAAG